MDFYIEKFIFETSLCKTRLVLVNKNLISMCFSLEISIVVRIRDFFTPHVKKSSLFPVSCAFHCIFLFINVLRQICENLGPESG